MKRPRTKASRAKKPSVLEGTCGCCQKRRVADVLIPMHELLGLPVPADYDPFPMVLPADHEWASDEIQPLTCDGCGTEICGGCMVETEEGVICIDCRGDMSTIKKKRAPRLPEFTKCPRCEVFHLTRLGCDVCRYLTAFPEKKDDPQVQRMIRWAKTGKL